MMYGENSWCFIRVLTRKDELGYFEGLSSLFFYGGMVDAGFRLSQGSERSTAGLITLYVLCECISKSRSEFGGNRLLKRNEGQVGKLHLDNRFGELKSRGRD